MANFRSIRVVHFLIIIFLHLSHALYEDQVGKFDWKRSFLGKVKYVNFEAKRILVATEQNLLASLNLKNGNIQWRQILEDPQQHQIELLHVDKVIVTVSGAKSNYFVRTWEINTGTLLSEWPIITDSVLSGKFFIYNGNLIHIIPVVGSHLLVTTYQLTGIENKGNTRKVPASFVKDPSNCIVANEYFVCLSSNNSNGYISFVNWSTENPAPISVPLKNLIGDSQGPVALSEFKSNSPSVLLLQDNVAKQLVFTKEKVEIKPSLLMPNAVNIEDNGKSVIFELAANDDPEKLLKVVVKDSSGQPSFNLEYPLEYPRGLGAPIILNAQQQTKEATTTDLLLKTSDDALLLVRLPEGKILWTREEALANIVATEFFELPVSELDASIEREFDPAGDILSMFVHRITTQAKQLYNLLFGGQLLTSGGLVRDEFGLHKIIVVATKVGKLFAIDSLTGAVAWSYRLPKVIPFDVLGEDKMFLFVQRTARYAPLPAQCVLLGEDALTGNGVLFEFDPITGYSTNGIQRLNYKIKQATLLPEADENYVKPILVLSHQNEAFIYPQSAIHIAKKHFSTTFIYTADTAKALLEGYSFKFSTEDSLKVSKVWDLRLAPSKLVTVNMKPPNERVHSQGRVLYDRSVYYKYVNPNLIAVSTVSEDSVHRHVLSIYLIDGVTGLVVYSASHKKARGPVHLVHSENWIIYSYFSERFRRTEIAAAELYEGHVQSNSTVFSSYAVSQLPQVQSQAYILPANMLKMAVTLTERGITNKFLLFGLSTGAVIELPWLLFQPRFSDIPCGPEESCIPYMPEVPLSSEAIINYNQTLAQIKGIEVAPARLESTVHVLVHGLDIFYTLVAPSKTFDVLKEDFDHRLIVLVLTGLIVASYVTKHLASKKALKQAWK